jgi:hypothetical protein
MFCGKTDELIRRLRRATIARQKVQVFKPVIDYRYSIEKVTSHAGSEFADAAMQYTGQGGDAWRLSALIGAHPADAGPKIRAFNTAHRGRFVVDVVECRAVSAGSVGESIGALPGELRIFVELPLLDDPRAMLLEIRTAGAWA